MFDSAYKFNYQGHTKTPTKPYLKLHKFYLKKHEQSERKYQLLSGLNDAIRVIGTSVEAMIWLYKKDNLSSFGFIGANSEGEEVANTKRFKLYVRIMLNLFSPNLFEHKEYDKNSAYLLLNKENSEEYDNLQEAIEEMFVKYYDMSL